MWTWKKREIKEKKNCERATWKKRKETCEHEDVDVVGTELLEIEMLRLLGVDERRLQQILITGMGTGTVPGRGHGNGTVPGRGHANNKVSGDWYVSGATMCAGQR